MQLGLNQNITYKEEVYHIQTEDGGRKNPFITTVLFRGGTILTSRKTTYADIIKSDKLDIVVKELMREQHNALIEGLMSGKFDKVSKTPDKGNGKDTKAAPLEKKPDEKKAAPPDKKSVDDIILEHLSLNEKGS